MTFFFDRVFFQKLLSFAYSRAPNPKSKVIIPTDLSHGVRGRNPAGKPVIAEVC
jgi:hypothetical protein